MCGIAGAFLGSSGDSVTAVRAMCQRMAKRGPDAQGEWFDKDAGFCLGNRRLSIIDLDSRANQPLLSQDGQHVIVFNGEIYNYRELRADLEKQGIRFRTLSDTEVVLELYRREGHSALALLRGMFAIAIWDVRKRVLFLARDPYGIKPLYVAQTPAGPLFASQVKALLASGLVSRASDPAGIAGFFIWGSVPEPFTIYRDIQPVPAGSWMIIGEEGASTTVQYANIESVWVEGAGKPDMPSYVRHVIMDSIRAHLVADVPIALLLSGGVDSGAIAGGMSELSHAVEGVTVSFDEFAGKQEDEVPRAELIARHYGVRNSVRRITKAEFLIDMPLILDAMDQPSIDGVNTWFAAKAVAERGYKVVLSGVGGDEIFCGYETFRTVPELFHFGRLLAMLGPLRSAMYLPFSVAANIFDKPKLRGIPEHSVTFEGAYLLRRALMTPNELFSVMKPGAAREGLRSLSAAEKRESGTRTFGPDNSIARVAALESTRYLRNQLLRDADWASMAHSLELRTPLVDWQLLRKLAPYVAEFALGNGKRLLGGVPAKPLPSAVVNHQKTGFGMPFAGWLENVAPHGHPLPRRMRSPWARRWACVVAEAFALNA